MALVFVPLLAAAMIGLFFVLVFAAQYFLTIVECTAHGQRTIQWPSEAFTEWLLKPVHLLWMAGLYLLPAVLLSAGAAKASPYLAAALFGLCFTLLFPIGAVSAFIANNVWTPIHPRAIPLMLAKPFVTLNFYFVGTTTFLIGTAGAFLALFAKEIGTFGAIAGGVLMALAWFAYACALGRLLFALTYTTPPPNKKRKKKKAKEKTPIPLVLQDEKDIPHWERPKPAWDPDRDETPYAVTPPADGEAEAKPDYSHLVKPQEKEMKLLEKEVIPPPPANPFGPDAFRPMGQAETMRHALLLAIMFAIESYVVRVLIDMNPAK